MSTREEFVRTVALDLLRDQVDEYIDVGIIAEHTDSLRVDDDEDSGIYAEISEEIQELQRWLGVKLDDYYTS